jgi:enolase
MKITGAEIKIIKDSRGEDTLEANLRSGNFFAVASCPSGKSRGAHEVFVLEPKLAVEKFEAIKSEVLSGSASGRIETQGDFDGFLIGLDGTPGKKNLGGNLILVLSLAFARLKAREKGLELFQYVQSIGQFPVGADNRFLRPIFNVINGGVHAKNNLSFQEFQIIPQVKDFGMALGFGQEFYKKLKEFLENKFGKENLSLGDEGGFSANFQSDEEAIEILSEIIKKYNYPVKIGLDVAASQFQKGINYVIGGKNYSADELRDFYLRLIKTYGILSIEDPFGEENFDDFAKLSHGIVSEGKLVIADDLTTTNPERLKTAIEKKSGNAILIKLNQIGTLSETLNVVRLAYENNWQAVVSHRSGETMDDFIADLAVGIGAWGLKSGAPYPPERMAKYERVLKIVNGR